MKNTNDESGFTLVEIIVVMVIIAIMLVIAAPNFMSWLPNLRFRDNSRNMLFDMQFTKTSAVKRNTNVVFLFNANSYTIFVDDGAGTGTANDDIQNGTEETLKTVSLPTDLTLTKTTLPANLVAFTPNGLPKAGSSGEFRIANNQSRQDDLVISIAGNIKFK